MITGRYFQSGPATRIAPRLWQGGLPLNLNDLPRYKFDLIVLCAKELQPYNNADNFPEGALSIPIEAYSAPLDDADESPTASDAYRAVKAARYVIDALNQGKRVLVTCAAGRNRSGLVTALSLIGLYGVSGREAAEVVRSQRPLALTNDSISAFLERIPAGSGYEAST